MLAGRKSKGMCAGELKTTLGSQNWVAEGIPYGTFNHGGREAEMINLTSEMSLWLWWSR